MPCRELLRSRRAWGHLLVTLNEMSAPSPMNVWVFREKGLPQSEVDQIHAAFERHHGPIRLQVERKPVELPRNGHAPDTLAWDDSFRIMSGLAAEHALGKDDLLCLLTTTPNEKNWYAANDPEAPSRFFMHFVDCEWVTTAPQSLVSAYGIIYCVIITLLARAKIDIRHIVHMETRGCLLDFCEDKAELSFGLRCADICGDCIDVFESAGFPTPLFEQIAAILESVRKAAVNTSQFLPEPPAFLAWPYPVAITRHKVVQSTRPLLRFLLLLDHFDSMVRYFFLAHEISEGRQPDLVDKPALGWWVEQLARSLKGTSEFREVVRIAEQEQVVMLRNERRGHGYMATSEDAYTDEAAALEQTLTRIEDELRPFFERYQLVIPREVNVADGRYRISGDLLVGSHSLHPPFEIMMDNPTERGLLDQHRVYLTDHDFVRFHAMHPFLCHETCPECKHPRLLIADGGNQYIDAVMGHRVRIQHRP